MTKTMNKINDEYHLAIGQALEIEAIIADWKRLLPIKMVTKKQEKLLEFMRELDKQ